MTTETTDLVTVIAERRRQIEMDAPCVGCGSTLASCMAERGKDPTAPPWFGCCARGTAMAPCDHRVSSGALAKLLDEIAAGRVRTVAEVESDRKPASAPAMLAQSVWWRRRSGDWARVAAMSAPHRYNTAAMLVRNADQYARTWLRETPLYRALTAGLTIQGDGAEPWQKTGRDPVTGEVTEVPPRRVRVCMDSSCGCSGEEHA